MKMKSAAYRLNYLTLKFMKPVGLGFKFYIKIDPVYDETALEAKFGIKNYESDLFTYETSRLASQI